MRGALTAAAAALLIAAVACSSNNSNTGKGGSGGGGATGGTGGGATPGSCQAIRMCAKDCADAACLATCKSRGTTDAQAAWQALYDCTGDSARGNCPMPAAVGLDCVCMAQCYDGLCLAETDACVAGATDIVCDSNCH